MILAKIFANGEDLTEGKGVYIKPDSVRDIESMGFAVVLMD